ncbi:MerR family transcriptional regulator [Bacillus changyiensis]|uniref:MerR family transcriptional regulator n=1 Tax=Bacillus changyiensis TaxID=3004103 RepID=UPI0022E73DC8|nr:MerR family transcriptional regulator [Bacillus changyiensis]MDA1476794.1 MerR family transcriptional regulator [Bacillus changyiensis]
MHEKAEYTIHEVSKMTGLSTHTLRYYEKEQLIKYVSRDQNGYRKYVSDHIEWIEFLKIIKKTNMPLEKIKLFGDLLEKGDSTLCEREQMLLAHHEQVLDEMESIEKCLIHINQKLQRYRRKIDNLSNSEQ